jgi:hypothetical protein
MRKFFLMTLGIFLLSSSTQAADSPVVLELFTSQSCSSCPPADKLLGELALQDNIIALSCNVTYWDHLHWKDTLSKQFCTERQRQYVQSLNSRGPYTPQIMVNGRQTMVGSKGRQINKAIAEEIKENPVKPIGLEISGDNLVITLPETPGHDSYALLLIPHGAAHHQEIPSGENRGRAVTYTNPVQKIISLGTWDGTGKKMDYDISEIKAAAGYVMLAQKNGVTGPIIAAAQITVN